MKTPKKVRIPRKMKKECYRERHIMNVKLSGHLSTPKLERYYYYFDVEQSIKKYNMIPEQLYKSFGVFTIDHIIWWDWVRWKHFGITPRKNVDLGFTPNNYQKYFNETMEHNNINVKI